MELPILRPNSPHYGAVVLFLGRVNSGVLSMIGAMAKGIGSGVMYPIRAIRATTKAPSKRGMELSLCVKRYY